MKILKKIPLPMYSKIYEEQIVSALDPFCIKHMGKSIVCTSPKELTHKYESGALPAKSRDKAMLFINELSRIRNTNVCWVPYRLQVKVVKLKEELNEV